MWRQYVEVATERSRGEQKGPSRARVTGGMGMAVETGSSLEQWRLSIGPPANFPRVAEGDGGMHKLEV